MAQFSSRPPFSDDPLPYVNDRPGVDNRYPDESTAVYFSGDVYRYDPRPEFNRPQTNPTNPILTAVRRGHINREALQTAYRGASLEGAWVDGVHIERAHLDHARRVLTRLAKLDT